MACRPLGRRGGPLASGAYGDQGRLSFGHRSANMECILRSDVRSAGYQEMQSRFQGFKVLLSFWPLGARKRSYIRTRHSL